jgi:hypothetical protein
VDTQGNKADEPNRQGGEDGDEGGDKGGDVKTRQRRASTDKYAGRLITRGYVKEKRKGTKRTASVLHYIYTEPLFPS